MYRLPKIGESPVPGYRLEKLLGSTHTATVWRARTDSGSYHALKLINIRERSGLKELRGITRVRRIKHENLLEILGCWVLDEHGQVLDEAGLLKLQEIAEIPEQSLDRTMQYAPPPPTTLAVAMPIGDTNLLSVLGDRQRQGHPGIPPEELLRYMAQAAAGIDHLNSPLHDLGNGPVAIQHCDIKPQNILLVGGVAKVCDFGLARVAAGNNTSTLTGSAGTPAYIAPECIENVVPSLATDQYSLAITYFELRTGRLPFADDSIEAVYQAHQTGKLELEALQGAERAVIERATSRRPEARYRSAGEMVAELYKAAGIRPPRGFAPASPPADEPRTAPDAAPQEQPPAPPRRASGGVRASVTAGTSLSVGDIRSTGVGGNGNGNRATAVGEKPPGEDTAALQAAKQNYERAVFRRSLDSLTDSIQTESEDALPLMCRGTVYWFFGDYDSAMADYARALERNGVRAAVHAGRAVARCAHGEFEAAIADCNEAIRLEPQEAVFYVGRALVFASLGDFPRAISDCSIALEHDDSCVEALAIRAEAYMALGDEAAAEGDLRRAVAFLK